jgi:uncharacterized protein (DUF2147 family)
MKDDCMRRWIVATIAMLTQLAATPARAADPLGTWLVEDQNGIVQIGDCGALALPQAGVATPAAVQPASQPTNTLCGMVVWLRDPLDPATGKPPVDKNNVDPARRGLPILGLRVFFDMMPSSTPDRWDGRVYNIDDGKTYDGSLIMKGESALRIQGCLLFVCQGENWTRQPLPEPVKQAPAARAPGGARAQPAPAAPVQPRAR